MPYAKRYRGTRRRRSFKTRKYSRKRYSTIRTMYKVAKKVVNANEERKHHDTDMSIATVTAWTGILKTLNNVPEDTTSIARIGAQTKGKALGLRLLFQSNLASAVEAVEWRVIIGYGHNELGANLSSPQIIEYPASSTTVRSPLAYNSSKKYTILKDDRFWTDKEDRKIVQRNYFFNLKGLVTKFVAGASNNYEDQGLFMFVWTSVDPAEVSKPSFAGFARYYFTDA